MRFAQYFDYSLSGELVHALGDRAVLLLDARNALQTSVQDAISANGTRRPFYAAFQLFQGRGFLDCHPITNIIPLEGA